ncbi:SH3 domain-containing protein C23A1.17-like [Eurytemora carolleeae]|uniref:SH3 domain-containing protein C23A1.17-like n=1 Tax=Eurytemora carolleeae TaxID=1294199 RepID=UPI000C7860AF|nr:SH3 domain-containing protein C23A1.17-like [Eurytemora carolleeae]|eukprot:XP_023339734.1 SH3 domain-containing protein C23A1.17-like [Eurytemora affinis]
MCRILDSARNSPMSDHSSHFDRNIHINVSALAREAKELQGKSNQKKEEQNSEGAEKSMNGVHETGNNKCLEDPTFTFDEPTAISKPEPVKPAASAANNKTPIDQPSINKAPLDAASVNKTSTDPAPISAAQMTAAPVVAAPIATAPVAAAHTVPAPTVAAPVETPKSTPSSIPVAKKPSYRVLEDPDMDLPPMKPSPYKVLEDPGMSMTASIYQPSASSTDIGKL